MKNALILHGAGNDHTGNWFPWLKNELEGKGYKVWSPDLPNSDVPVLKDWLETVFSNKDWNFDKESIIIGHSAGATFILRILEKLPAGTKIHKAILVSGPVQMGTIPDYFPYKREMVTPPFDWEKIKNSCEKFYFVCSDNDKYQCGEENSIIFHKHLGGEVILKHGQGHFNLEVSPDYKQFRGKYFPKKDVINIVVSSNPETNPEEGVIFAKSPKDVLEKVEENGFKKVMLIGGGHLNGSFLREGLIDEIYLDLHPLVFGEGIRVFEGFETNLKLEMTSSEIKDKGMIHIHYNVIK